MWGAVMLASAKLALINDNPTLVSEINTYQVDVDNGTAEQINHDIIPFDTDPGLLKTINVSSNSKIKLEIQIGVAVAGEDTADFVGDLSCELGHFVNYKNDLTLYNQEQNPLIDMVNVAGQNGPNYSAADGAVGTLSEAESEANNYVVQ